VLTFEKQVYTTTHKEPIMRKAFTLYELLICIMFLFVLAVMAGGFYTIIHFISKYW
jgi:hypothetical protein